MAAPGQNPFQPQQQPPIPPGVAPAFTSNANPVSAPTPGVIPPPSQVKPEMTLPPSLWGSTKPEPLRESIRNAKWLLISYALLLINGHLALLAVVSAYENVFGGVKLALLFTLPSIVGAFVGQIVGMLRVRSGIVWVGVIALTFLTGIAAIAVGPVVFAAWSFIWSFGCGHLAMQRKSSLSAIFMPVICWIGAILFLLQEEGRLGKWLHGDKFSVWHPIPLALLFLAITEIFLFFAGQEHFHTSVWQMHAGHETALKRLAGGGARMTGKGIFAIVVFSAVICTAVALISPYLWRTEERQGNGQGGNGSQQQGGQSGQGGQNGRGGQGGQNANDPSGNGNNSGNGSGTGNDPSGRGGNGNNPGGAGQNDPSGNGQSGQPEIDPDAVGRALERAKDEAEKSASWLLPLIPLFLVARPIRRAFLLRHLRRPFWRVNPSRRARNLWRYVLIALGDAGIKRTVSDSIDDEVRRIDTMRAKQGMQPAQGLSDAAKQYQRMRFGLGIPSGSLDELKGHVESAFQNVRAPLDEWQRFKSWWRKIEV